MRTIDLILKKRRGESLTFQEIEHLILGYTNGTVPDYQMAAWAMAVYFQGMDKRETADLTQVMLNSGGRIDLSAIDGVKVDKHSTGGVGDKTTLVLAPLVASVGVPVAKMSGRGLGHTGGTIDKLEAIPGFSVELSREAFVAQVNRIGLAITGQTGNLAPADKKLYALRDVTGTVDSLPLIASSVMSKKLAAGADAIVLDVKVGTGAFMKTEADAANLAQTMVDIGKKLNRSTVAVVSDMNQPLGFAVGNALEVAEAVATLKGEGPDDLTELCLELGSHMVVLAGQAENHEIAKARLAECIENGKALAKFKALIEAQGGDPKVVDDTGHLPQSRWQHDVTAEADGIVARIDAEKIGLAAMVLGAGRNKKDDSLDLSVGVVLHKKIGDFVKRNEPLATVHYNDDARLSAAVKHLTEAYQLHGKNREVQQPPLVYRVIR